MNLHTKSLRLGGAILLLAAYSSVTAGEKQIVSLKNMSDEELKHAGFELKIRAPIHIKALGAGGDHGWTYKSDEMCVYGWIINAATRDVVWEMTVDNTSKTREDLTFDGTVDLPAGSYDAYFTAAVFNYHSAFSNIRVNVDHRQKPLFGEGRKDKKHLFDWLTGWGTEDIETDWQKHCKEWGIEILVDESVGIANFDAPRERANFVLKETGLGDGVLIRKGFVLSESTTMSIYAVGEGEREGELADYGWIVNAGDRRRVWEMRLRNCRPAGGARKNIRYADEITLAKGEYILYYLTDGTHSTDDWNANPPYDPLNWGVTLSVRDDKKLKNFKSLPYDEDRNIIASLVRVKDGNYLTAGFTLKEEAKVRVYALGERGNSSREMADFGTILDAKTRNKVWTMDLDRSSHAGGASKNRFIDEVITLPRGNYMVVYQTDDSHGYDDWNADPPFDPEHYGITVMGFGENWSSAIVAKYVEERDKNIIAQIVKPGDNVDKAEKFTLDKVTRVRIYAIGEGVNREMADYGWVEDARAGNIIWEMTYSMTFHAGGGRKNRMVNTTILLERGEYRLHYKSDDSHSFGDWNTDPPEDQQYWGITLFKDDSSNPIPPPPTRPLKKELPNDDGE